MHLFLAACYIQNMNAGQSNRVPSALSRSESIRAFEILNELAADDSLTQKDLSNRLGIAVGLVNTYLKNLVKKGYIKVSSLPPRKYVYLLTPQGIAEKTRLTYQLLKDYNRIYREARENLSSLLGQMEAEGTKRILFAGADEVAEIAYLTLQETGMELVGIVDDDLAGKEFLGWKIAPISTVANLHCDAVVVTTYWRRMAITKALKEAGLPGNRIRTIFPR